MDTVEQTTANGANNQTATNVPSTCFICKVSRKPCLADCVYRQNFPIGKEGDLRSIHKLFGLQNFVNMIGKLPQHHKNDAIMSMIQEAKAREKFPVLGIVQVIQTLEKEIKVAKLQLAWRNDQIAKWKEQMEPEHMFDCYDEIPVPNDQDEIYVEGLYDNIFTSRYYGFGVDNPYLYI